MSGCHDNIKRMLKQMILTIFSVTKEMFRIITFVDLFANKSSNIERN